VSQASLLLATFSVATAAVAAGGYGTFMPRSALWGKVISRGPTTGNKIALTFDDGPTPGATEQILDILRELGVPATFFVIGLNAEKHPDLLRRIHAEGHLLGNHSRHHAHYAMFRGRRYWREEFDRTNSVIRAVTQADVRFFRPPMGIKTPIILGQSRKSHMRTVAWTHRAHDGFATTPRRIVERLTNNVTPGSILLIHDGIEPNHPRDPLASIQSVRPVIETLRRQALEFVRLDALLD
jgi:peptidoglycan-N-acetylglucosamine deacetylase